MASPDSRPPVHALPGQLRARQWQDLFGLLSRFGPRQTRLICGGFVLARAFTDRFNHPALNARLDLGQSWKRTLGWALEKVLVKHYGGFLERHGVRLLIPQKPQKIALLQKMSERIPGERLEADKVDVFLVGSDEQDADIPFGVVHVKNSFAERRTDDEAMSKILVSSGFCSPLWTMDCKAQPSAHPVHTGELGRPEPPDRRRAKRMDIEDSLYFSACFSYNQNTIATPVDAGTRGRVIVCDFSDPDDDFARFVLQARSGFRH